jgi:hypothetical protein
MDDEWMRGHLVRAHVAIRVGSGFGPTDGGDLPRAHGAAQPQKRI